MKNEILEIRLPAWILPSEAQKIIQKFTRSFEKRKKPKITSDAELKTVPKWVLQAIIVHELTHLIVPNHSKKFWQIANRYSLMERARGYLLVFEKYNKKT